MGSTLLAMALMGQIGGMLNNSFPPNPMPSTFASLGITKTAPRRVWNPGDGTPPILTPFTSGIRKGPGGPKGIPQGMDYRETLRLRMTRGKGR